MKNSQFKKIKIKKTVNLNFDDVLNKNKGFKHIKQNMSNNRRRGRY